MQHREVIADVIRLLGHALNELSVAIAGGRTGGFAFKMHYLMAHFRSLARAGPALYSASDGVLTAKCTNDPEVVRATGGEPDALAGKLAAHVPAELR